MSWIAPLVKVNSIFPSMQGDGNQIAKVDFIKSSFTEERWQDDCLGEFRPILPSKWKI